MAPKSAIESDGASTESALIGDERWQLAQRIVESEGFERASQLRKILLYVTRSAILEPERVLREYDIACDVLERRKDFDPGSDNIVRSQFSHLRRKLDLYFLEEGREEALTVKIPKGSYLPLFVPARVSPQVPVSAKHGGMENLDFGGGQTVPPKEEAREERGWWRERIVIVAVLCLLPSFVLGFLLLRAPRPTQQGTDQAAQGNAFLQFLKRSEGQVTVVVPDLTLVLLENFLEIDDVPVADYVNGGYAQKQLAAVKDPALRQELTDMSVGRLTTYNEAMVASDLMAAMTRLGVPSRARYARDMHVGDLSDGNTILIGGPGSDPWYWLFYDKLNFRFVDDRETGSYYFEDRNPGPGEQAKYPVTYPQKGEQPAIGYVNVALTPNPAHSGYTLLIIGADEQEVESAMRFLLRGKLPPEISSVLSGKDLRYFEIFLRGTHIVGEADSTFDVVAIRPR
jgi:hypothetical protein